MSPVLLSLANFRHTVYDVFYYSSITQTLEKKLQKDFPTHIIAKGYGRFSLVTNKIIFASKN